MITNIEALKKACALRTLVVEIPGTSESVTLRELSVKDRSDHLKLAKDNPDYMHLSAFLVARSCDGLTDDDIPTLMELVGADHVQFLGTQVLKLSGLLNGAVEEEVKN